MEILLILVIIIVGLAVLVYIIKDPKKTEKITIVISFLALATSVISVFFDLYFDLSYGNVQPLEPSGYCIIRGISHFPSDHIVLPLEWENTGGLIVLVRNPCLVLRELDPGEEEIGDPYYFFSGRRIS